MMPQLFSASCMASYSVKLTNGSNIPEFLRFEQSTMTLKYGSKMAVDLFGINDLYSNYSIDWIGLTNFA